MPTSVSPKAQQRASQFAYQYIIKLVTDISATMPRQLIPGTREDGVEVVQEHRH